jgi:hypothetical protein
MTQVTAALLLYWLLLTSMLCWGAVCELSLLALLRTTIRLAYDTDRPVLALLLCLPCCRL